MTSPNVILIVLDTARADAFEPWGGRVGTTPVLADLAREGHASTRAIAPSCWTMPSHVSMFGGRDAREFGLSQAPGGQLSGVRGPLRDAALELLPSVLRSAGYETRGASANTWLSGASGFDTGFGHFASLRYERSASHADPRLRGRLRWLAGCAHPTDDDGARHGRAVLETWLADRTLSKPFFWFMNLVECHSPYMPPHPFNSLGLVDRLRAAVATARFQTFDGFLRINVTEETIDPASLDLMRTLYLDSIRWLDHWLEWLVTALEQHGLADDTILIITSDHGEHFGEHGLWGHGHALDDELLHVPLVARGPAVGDWPDLCSLTLLPYLIARATGVEPRPTWERPGPIVVSTYDRLSSPEDKNFSDLASRMPLTERGRDLVTTSLTSASDGTSSILVRGGEGGVADDLDVTFTGPDDPVVRTKLWDAVAPALDALARNPDVNASTVDAPEDTPELLDQLRLLGYAD